MKATIQLDKQTAVSTISLNLFVNTRGGLFLSKSLTIEVSPDGKKFKTVHTKKFVIIESHQK